MSTITLYHRASRENADAIVSSRHWISREYDGSVYFSTHPNGGAAEGYGPIVLAVTVPADLPLLDDEFPDGEQHFRLTCEDLAGLPVTEQ